MRCMTLALRVLGSASTKRMSRGLSGLPSSAATRFSSAWRRGSSAACPAFSTQKATTSWSLIGWGTPMAADSLTAGMGVEDRLHLGRSQPLARHLDGVVAPPKDVPQAVVVDGGEVAVHPRARDAVPVGVEVALTVLPEAARHPDPRLADYQLAHRAAHRVAVGVHHVGIHAGHRAAEGAGLERRQEVAAHDAAADFRPARVVDDRLAPFEHGVKEPQPRFGIPGAAGRADHAQACDV